MVVCIVRGCRNRSGRDKISFFRIPGGICSPEDRKCIVVKRRAEWLRRMNTDDCKMKHARVCAAHFISGKPSDKHDVDNPDWAPSLNLEGCLSPEIADPQEIESDPEKPKEKILKKRNRKRSSSTRPTPPRKRARRVVKMFFKQKIKTEPPEEPDENPKGCPEVIPSALCEVVITPEIRSASQDDFNTSTPQLRRESKNYSRSTASNQVLFVSKDNDNKTIPPPDRHLQLEPSEEFYGVSPTNSSNNEEHPIEIFFRSMARTVMKFPPHLMAEARMMVCSLVSEMEIRSIYEGYS